MAENRAKCHICGKGFSNPGNRDRHIKGIHQNIQTFKCSLCDKAYSQKANYDAHQKNMHGIVSGQKAHNSKMSHHKSRNHLSGFPMKGRFGVKLPRQSSKNHSTSGLSLFNRKNVAGRTCDVCQTVFAFRQGMLTHRKVHFERRNASIKNPQISRGHTETSLNTESLKIIPISPNSESTASSLTKGNRSKQTCDICHQVFSYRFVMLRHRRGHFTKKDGQMGESISKDEASSKAQHQVKQNHLRGAFTCNICQTVFSFKTSMVRHRKLHFQKDDGSKKRIQIERGYVDKANIKAKLRCDICGKSFGHRSNMLKHQKLHLSKENNAAEDDGSLVDSVNLNKEGESSTDKGEEPSVGHESHPEAVTPRDDSAEVTCDICGKTYANSCNMLRHRKTHSKPSRKELSDSEMENESETQHIIDEDEREKINKMMQSRVATQCLICHKKVSRNWGLKVHVKGVHLKVKRYTCKCCVYTTNRKLHMLKHVQQKHSSVRTDNLFQYQRKASKDKYGRRRSWHAARGLQMIPKWEANTCHICFKVFSQRNNVYRHIRQVHASELENPERPDVIKIPTILSADPVIQDEALPHSIKKRQTREDRTCEVCHKVFYYRKEMLMHKAWMHRSDPEHGVSPHIKTLNKRSLEFQHIKKRHTRQQRTCDVCEKIFPYRSEMLRHRSLHPPGKVCAMENHSAVNDPPPIQVEAPLEGATSGSIQDSEPPTKKAPLKNIECDICNKLFFTNFSMLRHKSTHSSDKIPPTRAPLTLHDEKNTRSDTQAPFECEEDKSQMSNISASKYKCKKCNKLFLSRSLLAKHRYAYHVRRRKYACSECDKQFTLQYHLDGHTLRVHGRAPIHTKPDNEISDSVNGALSKTSAMSAPPPKPPPYPIKTESTEVRTQRSTSYGPDVEIPQSRHRNSSGSSHSSWTPSVGSSPSVRSSHSASSMHSARSSPSLGSLGDMKVYRCTMCRHIFTNSDDWREHLSQHLGGGTKIIYLGSTDCDSTKCKDGEKPAENTWSYTCPSCKVEVQGSLNLVMHIKGHML